MKFDDQNPRSGELLDELPRCCRWCGLRTDFPEKYALLVAALQKARAVIASPQSFDVEGILDDLGRLLGTVRKEEVE